MTTAPTPEEVRALAERLEHCVAKWGKQNALSLEAYSAVKMMRHLQASYQALQTENERLRMELVAEARAAAEQKLRADQLAQQHRMQAQMHAQATQQLAEMEASKNARIHKLEMQALDLASENSILKRAEESELEARKPLPLSDNERLRLRSDVARAIWDVMREYEDRCDHALEDVDPRHQVWDCADAAIKAVHGITGGST